ncbi:MAG: transcriptional regulator [Devosia sp.]
MSTLHVGLGTMEDMRVGLLAAVAAAEAGQPVEPRFSLNFASYDDMYRVLAPSRLAIVKVLAGQGPLAIREVARRVGRDVQAVHRDVTTLINSGVIDRDENGVSFPYDEIDFQFKVTAAA